MRQISPNKKTHLYLLQNARTFETKRKYISSKTHLRFNPNVKAFFYQEEIFKKITSAVPENSPETADVLVYKIRWMLRKPYGRALQCLLLKSGADYLRCRHH